MEIQSMIPVLRAEAGGSQVENHSGLLGMRRSGLKNKQKQIDV